MRRAHTGLGKIHAAKRSENSFSVHAGLSSEHLYPHRANFQGLEEVAIFQMPNFQQKITRHTKKQGNMFHSKK